MLDAKKQWSIDWQHFDWSVVNAEVELSNPSDEDDITTMTRTGFTEYLNWLKENNPELLFVVGMIQKLEQEGAPQEEIDKWKNVWDSKTQNNR